MVMCKLHVQTMLVLAVCIQFACQTTALRRCFEDFSLLYTLNISVYSVLIFYWLINCSLFRQMPRLNQQNRNQALGMLDGGAGIREVARHFNVDVSTIVRLRRRFNTTGSVADRPRQGGPRVLTPADERFIRLSSLRNRFRPATSITNELN